MPTNARYNFQYLDTFDTWTRRTETDPRNGLYARRAAEGTIQRNYSGGAINTPRFSK
jgi:hypothetical protein